MGATIAIGRNILFETGSTTHVIVMLKWVTLVCFKTKMICIYASLQKQLPEWIIIERKH